MVGFLLVSSAFGSGQEEVADIIQNNYSNYQIVRLPNPLKVYSDLESKGLFKGKSKVKKILF
jgi:hypothetical protein